MNSKRRVIESVPLVSIDAAMTFLSRGEHGGSVDGEFVWARQGERILTVAGVGQPAGRVVDIVLPDGPLSLPMTDGRAVIEALDTKLRALQGVHFAQALLPSYGGYWSELLPSFEFLQVATIDLLASLPATSDSGEDRLEFVRMETLDSFGPLVKETWQGSLDCELLNDNRSVDDLVEEYRVRCHGNLKHWYSVQMRGSPVGCLILNVPATSEVISVPAEGIPLETVYWGVVPSVRGRGLGDEVLRFVRQIAALEGRMVTAAVDRRNSPALAVYHRNGFQCVASRRLFVKYL